MTIARMARLALAVAVLAGTAPAVAAELDALVLESAWARATPPGAAVAAGYLTVTNTGEVPARLVGGDSAAAARIEIHEMAIADGVMRMRELADGLTIPPGETVALEPGGYHLMLMALAEPLVAGQTVAITLRFAEAGTIELPFTIAPLGASEPPAE